MLTIEKFFKDFEKTLALRLRAGNLGLTKSITIDEIERPGLALTGFLKGYSYDRILVFGSVEMGYLETLTSEDRRERLSKILSPELPMVLISRDKNEFVEMKEICDHLNIPLFVSSFRTAHVIQDVTYYLSRLFSPSESVSGTLVEAFGKGVLIQGDSSIGKSETALGLIVRQHRLVSDDVVIINKREGSYLEGEGPSITRHVMEIRGIGIINVAHLYGAVCVSEKVNIDVVVKLEAWDNNHFYDRVGLEEKTKDILGIAVPYYILPVKPGRDAVLLIETIVLNHRLKKMGVNSAKEFNIKLLDTIAKKSKLVH
jgi:HPr kinase/phosphorylase